MKSNGLPPSELEWANADLEVTLVGESEIVGLTKTIERNGEVYSQTVWLTLTQLRAVAIDYA